jgi:hypothetical protein
MGKENHEKLLKKTQAKCKELTKIDSNIHFQQQYRSLFKLRRKNACQFKILYPFRQLKNEGKLRHL